MSLRRVTGTTIGTFVTSTDELYLSYAINDQLEISRPNRAGRTRSRITILTGNTPLRPDYHRAARNEFAVPAAPAPLSKAPFRSSPSPRSARLGSTMPLDHPSTAVNTQMDPTPTAPPVSKYATPEYDACAAAGQLSKTLLSYSLCDATRSYIQLGRPNPPPRFVCNYLPSHTRPESVDITDLAAKGRLLEGDDDTILLVRKPITTASAPNGHDSRRSRPPFDNPVRTNVPLLARSWIMHACHADASCHSGVTRTLKMLELFYWWLGMEICPKRWVRRCVKCQTRKTSRQTIRWPTLFIPFPEIPGISVSVDYVGTLPTTARGNSYILLFTDRFSRRAVMFTLSPPRSSQQKVLSTS